MKRRTKIIFAIVVLVFSFLLLLNQFASSLLPFSFESKWITYSHPISPYTRPAVELEAVFSRTFSVAEIPSAGRLSVRAFRAFFVQVNGKTVPVQSDAARWKNKTVLDISPLLQKGANEIKIAVVNKSGAPALSCLLEVGGERTPSDSSWDVSWAGSEWKKASFVTQNATGFLADPDLARENPLRLSLSSFGILFFGGILLIIVGLLFVPREKIPAISTKHILIAGGLFWIALFLNNSILLPWNQGFDHAGHHAYIKYVLQFWKIPYANQGWEMFQPPLYYFLSSGFLRVFSLLPDTFAGSALLRMFGMALGLVNLTLVYKSMKILFPGESKKVLAGGLFALFLPAHIFVFHYVSNEGLSLVLCTAIIYQALKLLMDSEPASSDYVIFGLLAGAALLTKSTPIIAIALGLGVMGAQIIVRRRHGIESASWHGLILAVILMLIVCAPYYVKVARLFGSVFVGNWDHASGYQWWQDPGYLTWKNLFAFGSVFTDPFLNGGGRLLDGIYATLWGDSLGGGSPFISYRPPWNYNWMALGYVAALAPTVCICVGLFRMASEAIRQRNFVWTLLILLLASSLAALVYLVLKIPAYATVKSFYLLGVVLVPLSASFVIGYGVLSSGNRFARAALNGVLIGFCFTVAMSFWVRKPVAQTSFALTFAQKGDNQKAADVLTKAIEKNPEDWNARLLLALLMRRDRTIRPEIVELLKLDSPDPVLSRRFTAIANLYLYSDFAKAADYLAKAVAANPIDDFALKMSAQILSNKGKWDEAAALQRKIIGLNPVEPASHRWLAEYYERQGQQSMAVQHLKWANAIEGGR